jgi:hypothetical protein
LRRRALLWHPLGWHLLRWHLLLRVCRVAGLRLALGLRVPLWWVRLGLCLLPRVWRSWVGGWRVTRLLWVAARSPGGSRWHARLTSLRPALRGRRRHTGVLARWLTRLPRWHLAWAGLPVGRVRGSDRPLLIRRDIGGRRALERRLAAAQQVEEASLVDIEVSCQRRVYARVERELAAPELPQEIEGLPGATDPAATRVRQRTPLKGIDPVPARLPELQNPRLAAVDHLVQESEQPDPIDGAERRRLGLGARFPFALGEELHTAVTGKGAPSLPV